MPLKSKPTLGISNYDVKHNVSLFHKSEEVQSYTKMKESNDPVLLHFEQSLAAAPFQSGLRGQAGE